MIKLVYTTIFSLFVIATSSQTVLMMNNVHEDLAEQQSGENLGGFNMLVIKYGHYIDVPAEIGIQTRRSFMMHYGILHKHKLNRSLSVLAEQGIGLNNFRITQDSVTFFKDSVTYDRERLTLFSWDFSLGLRFNFDRNRGNHLGWYLDVLVYGGWNFSRRRNIIMYGDLDNERVRYKITERRPDYMRRFNYGAEVRFGYSYLNVFARYRLSNLFRTSDVHTYPELSPWSAGILLTLPRM